MAARDVTNGRLVFASVMLVVFALLLGGCSGGNAWSDSKPDVAESSSHTPTPPTPLS